MELPKEIHEAAIEAADEVYEIDIETLQDLFLRGAEAMANYYKGQKNG